MEQHPVPRNISSFQFHLVGDMTVKQFVYLAGGVFVAFLIIKFSPFPTAMKWIVGAIPAFSGAAFAFLPIQDRPLDKWLFAFIKSINSPTQYVWQKEAVIPDILLKNFSTVTRKVPENHQLAHDDAKKKLDTYLQSLPKAPHQMLNINEKKYVNKTLELFSSGQAAPSGGFVQPGGGNIQPMPTLRPDNIDTIRPARIIKQPVKADMEPEPKTGTLKVATIPQPATVQLQQAPPIPAPAKPALTPIPANPPAPPAPPAAAGPQTPKAIPSTTPAPAAPATADTEKAKAAETAKLQTVEEEKMKSILEEKAKLQQELLKLKEELTKSRTEEAKAPADKPNIIKPQIEAEKIQPTIKTVTPKTAVNEIGIPRLPQTPNIIMGVIKDTQGKQLPNIILTIKDTKDIPHRALKTNRLGQFSTATPLSNGTYYIEAEDPLKRYVFDIAEIILNGKVFLPIEIDAKGEKELMREKLTKEIFGNQASA